ncbi:MAG: malto-oligosyltrehalose trehalohydrolase [Bryobacteraceae bacterium]
MHTFQVWAPLAESMAVQIGTKRIAMQPGERGWWQTSVAEANAGTDYFFVIDDGDPKPDPRSAWQSEGVNGPSRVVDHSRFRWTDKNWQARPLASAIIYELHIGTLTPEGTFAAAIQKIPYLLDLGVTHIEIMPVNEFSGPWGWGYDGVDLYAPHHQYGTPDDLKALINACHEQGMAVLLDVVYNHFGPVGNYLSSFGPYYTEKHKTPWGAAVNLDSNGSHEVRRFFIDNALMWLRDYHFDGLRLDAVHAFVDNSAFHFLEELSRDVEALSSQVGKHFVLIAESDLNDPRIVTSREAGGYGIDAQWCDEFHHALHSVLTGEQNGYYEDFGTFEYLGKAIKNGYVYDGGYSKHRDRYFGRSPVHLSGHHFVVFTQNHDQVGNRAQGDRLSQLVNTGRQKIAAALMFTSPFIPMLFMGEEYSASTPFQYFAQHEDKELARLVSEGRRNEFKAFGWKPEEVPDPQAEETFRRSKLDWNETEDGEHGAMLRWYKDLIALRKSTSSLTDGRRDQVHVACDPHTHWLTVQRGEVEVVCNFSNDRQAIPIRIAAENVFCSEQGWQARPGLIELPGDSVAILRPASETFFESSPAPLRSVPATV